MRKLIFSFIVLLAPLFYFGGLVDEVEASTESAKIPTGSLIETMEVSEGEFGKELAGETSLRQAIIKVINFVLTFIGVLAVAVIIFAGFRLIISGGDDGAKEKAQKMIIYAIVGIIIVLLSYAIVNTVIKNVMTDETYAGQREQQSKDDANNAENTWKTVSNKDQQGEKQDIYTDNGYYNDIAFIPKGARLPGAAFTPGVNLTHGYGGGYGTSPAHGQFTQQPTGGPQFVPIDSGSGFTGATLFESATSSAGGGGGGYVPVNPVQPGGQGFTSIFRINPIVVSGDDVVDYGDGVSVPLETGKKGVLIQFTLPGYVKMDMGDGTSRNLDTSDGSRGDFTHIYGESGKYIIRANSQNVDGGRKTYTKEVIVGALEAVISGVKTQGRVDEPMRFSGNNSRTIVGTIASHEWSCEGGAGCFDPFDSENIRVVFQEPGTYTVRLKVKNSLRIVDEDTITVVIKGNIPVAKFKIRPTFNPLKPAEFVFDANESVNIDGLRENLLYRWDFGGEYVETYSPVVTYEFGTAGRKEVGLQVVQKEQTTVYASEVFDQDMEVVSTLGLNFQIGLDSIKSGDIVYFQGNSPKATEFEWVFPQEDGSIYGPRVRNTFDVAGAFPVTLKVYDQFSGETNELTKIVYVRNEGKPTAIMNITYGDKQILTPYTQINRGDPIQFESKSLDDSGGTDNLRETWLVNGKAVEKFQINQFFQDLGTYHVELIASNRRNANLRDRTSFKVVVNNTPPEIDDVRFYEDSDFGYQRVRVEADARDVDGEIVQYRFEALHNQQIILAQITESPYTYFNLQQLPGVIDYYFRVNVVDNDNAHTSMSSLSSLAVDSGLTNSAPLISIHAVPGNAGTTDTNFNFVAEAQDNDGDHLTFEWDFPDGKRFGKFLNYRFAEPGEYTVALTVTDDIETVTREVNMYITESENYRGTAGTDTNLPPQVAINGILPFHTVEVGTPIRFYSQASDLDGDDLSYRWDFGDGNHALIPHAVHRYGSVGVYDLVLTVSDGLIEISRDQRITIVPEGTLKQEDLKISPQDLAQYEPQPHTMPVWDTRINKFARFNPETGSIDYLDSINSVEEAAISLENPSAPEVLDQADVSISSTFQTNTECTQLVTLKPLADEQLDLLRKKIDTLDYISDKRKSLETERKLLLASYESVQYNCTDNNIVSLKVLLGIDPNIGEFEPVSIAGGSSTTFFLYGEAPVDYPRALDFEWDLGDGRQIYGQNVSFQYEKAGRYRVVLTVSDGVVEVSDSLTITVNHDAVVEDEVPAAEELLAE